MNYQALAGVSLTVAGASQVFTQTLAYMARYVSALGTPLVTWDMFWQRHALYWPWEGLRWVWRWGWDAPEMLPLPMALASGVLVLGLMATGQKGSPGWRKHPPVLEGHGTARWANLKDMKRANVLEKRGIVLGGYGQHILRFNGPENVLLVGPQRQGKGTGVIIPTLLELQEHAVVVDVRGETWENTAGYRSTFSRCLRLSLTQPHSARFNPLLEVRKGTHAEFMDAALLADMLVDPGQSNPNRDHWEKTAKALLACGVLYEVHTQRQPSLSHMASFWSRPGQSTLETLEEVVATAPTQQIAELAQEVVNKTANEASGVLSSMLTQLFLFRDPMLAANTAVSDFRLMDFARQDAWTSLYIVLSPGEEEHLRPFMRIFLRMALQRWLEMSATKHRITLLMDEFTSWGRIPFFVNNLAVLGGRGIRTLLAVQNVPQLADTYGKSDVITEQCKVRIYFAANGQTTGEEISRQTGVGTAITRQSSQRRSWYEILDGSTSMTEQHHARRLLTADEAMQIPQDHAVVQVTGYPSIWAKKTPFWQHAEWRKKSAMIPPRGLYG